MPWITISSTLLLAALTAIGITRLNAARFAGRVRVAAALQQVSAPTRPLDDARLKSLPPVVQRYLSQAIARDRAAVRTVHLEHSGSFRPKLDAGWLPIRGVQYFRADPPAFLWWGRVRAAPGVWIDARDRFEDGRGNMLPTGRSARRSCRTRVFRSTRSRTIGGDTRQLRGV